MFKEACVIVGLITVVNGFYEYFIISEEEPIGYYIGNVASGVNLTSESCKNASNKHVTFRMLPSDDSSYFLIDSETGNLITNNRIDRDAICKGDSSLFCQMRFEFVAYRGSDPHTCFQLFAVIVMVRDLNDNAPIFPNPSINVTIPEVAAIGATWALDHAVAVDKDSYENNVQWYSFFPNDIPFVHSSMFDYSSNHSLQTIVVTHYLDRETVDHYSFSLIAVDRGSPPRTGTTTVNVRITDINDNAPIFEKYNYTTHIYENFPVGDPILNVMAFDSDIGNNAMITYRLSEQQSRDVKNTFSIDSARGIIQLAQHLNNGTAGSIINVLVEAVDHGVPALTGSTVVTITVNEPIEQIVG